MKHSIKINLIFFLLSLVIATNSFSQEILTADNFFQKVSERYSQIQDYEADVTVTAGKEDLMTGKVIYKSPNLMRMDFSDPASQIILFDGQTLTVYIPELRAILTQETGTGTTAAGLTSSGLRMMSRSYAMAYESGPTASPLNGSESENVIRLVLSRLTVAEGFRRIILSINPDTLLIRRMEGVTLSGTFIQYDFMNIQLNQGILDAQFMYESPATANAYNNFLFSSEN